MVVVLAVCASIGPASSRGHAQQCPPGFEQVGGGCAKKRLQPEPKKRPRRKPVRLSCRVGQVKLGGACCWPGQAVVDGTCRGIPNCPSGFRSKAEQCELEPCEKGRVRASDRMTCCWPGQGATEGVCRGIPSGCPPNYDVVGEACSNERYLKRLAVERRATEERQREEQARERREREAREAELRREQEEQRNRELERQRQEEARREAARAQEQRKREQHLAEQAMHREAAWQKRRQELVWTPALLPGLTGPAPSDGDGDMPLLYELAYGTGSNDDGSHQRLAIGLRMYSWAEIAASFSYSWGDYHFEDPDKGRSLVPIPWTAFGGDFQLGVPLVSWPRLGLADFSVFNLSAGTYLQYGFVTPEQNLDGEFQAAIGGYLSERLWLVDGLFVGGDVRLPFNSNAIARTQLSVFIGLGGPDRATMESAYREDN